MMACIGPGQRAHFFSGTWRKLWLRSPGWIVDSNVAGLMQDITGVKQTRFVDQHRTTVYFQTGKDRLAIEDRRSYINADAANKICQPCCQRIREHRQSVELLNQENRDQDTRSG